MAPRHLFIYCHRLGSYACHFDTWAQAMNKKTIPTNNEKLLKHLSKHCFINSIFLSHSLFLFFHLFSHMDFDRFFSSLIFFLSVELNRVVFVTISKNNHLTQRCRWRQPSLLYMYGIDKFHWNVMNYNRSSAYIVWQWYYNGRYVGVLVTKTWSCSLELNSIESYNNASWHQLTIYSYPWKVIVVQLFWINVRRFLIRKKGEPFVWRMARKWKGNVIQSRGHQIYGLLIDYGWKYSKHLICVIACNFSIFPQFSYSLFQRNR